MKPSLIQKYAKGGYLSGIKNGKKKALTHSKRGGFAVGAKHGPEGGIKAVVGTEKKPIEFEGGEVIITAPAVYDNTLHEFNGKMLTNRQILSEINVSGGGVSFAHGGEIPPAIKCTGKRYKYGGKTLTDYDIAASSCGCKHKPRKKGQVFIYYNNQYDIDKAYKLINSGLIQFDIKEVPVYNARHQAFNKEYSDGLNPDYSLAQGLMIRLPNGNDFLIDGHHRMAKAYAKGLKKMKVYYISNPETVGKFSKKLFGEGGLVNPMKDTGRRLKKAVRTDDAFEIIEEDNALKGSNWTEGGCYPLAIALKRMFGGELVFIEDEKGIAQHVALSVNDGYLDGNGFFTKAGIINYWKTEGIKNPAIKGFDINKIGPIGIPDNDKTVDKLESLLKKALFSESSTEKLLIAAWEKNKKLKSVVTDSSKLLQFVQEQATGLSEDGKSVHFPPAYKSMVDLFGKDLVLQAVSEMSAKHKELVLRKWKGAILPKELREAVKSSDKKFSQSGKVENSEPNVLSVIFSNTGEFEKAKELFETEKSSFSPFFYNDEFKSIDFEVSGSRDADITETGLNQELSFNSISSYRFESFYDNKMEDGGIVTDYRNEIKGYNKLKQVEEGGGYIKTNEVFIDEDYDVSDVESERTKAFKIHYLLKWYDNDTNKNPDTEEAYSIDEAYRLAQIPGEWWNGTIDHFMSIEPVYTQVWLNKDGTEYEETGVVMGQDEFYQTEEGQNFINDFGYEKNENIAEIYTKEFGSRDDNSRSLESIVYQNLGADLETEFKADNGEFYQIKHKGAGKYSYLIIVDKNGEEIDRIKLRVSDHTYNPANNDEQERSGKFISVEIANINATENKFNTKYSLKFTGNNTYEEVLNESKDRLQYILSQFIDFPSSTTAFNWSSFQKMAYSVIKDFFEHHYPAIGIRSDLALKNNQTNTIYRCEPLFEKIDDKIYSVRITYFEGISSNVFGMIVFDSQSAKFSYEFPELGINEKDQDFKEGGILINNANNNQIESREKYYAGLPSNVDFDAFFDRGGDVFTQKRYHIKKNDQFFARAVPGVPVNFVSDIELAYLFNIDQAEDLKDFLEKNGYKNMQIVPVNNDAEKIEQMAAFIQKKYLLNE